MKIEAEKRQTVEVDVDPSQVLLKVLKDWIRNHLEFSLITNPHSLELDSKNNWVESLPNGDEIILRESTRSERITFKGLNYAIEFCEDYYD